MELMQVQGNVVSGMTTHTNPKTDKEFGVLPLAVGVGKETTHYVDLVINGGLMAVVEQHATKGRSLFVTGQPRLNPRSDGTNCYPNLSLSVDEFQLVDDKGGSRGLMVGTVLGRLVADPEVVTSSKGTEFTAFRMAVDHGRGDNKVTTYASVAVFDSLRTVAGYLSKGQKATVLGNAEPRAFARRNGEAGAEMSFTAMNIVLGSTPGDNDAAEDGDDDEEPPF